MADPKSFSVLGYDSCGANIFAAYSPSLDDAKSDVAAYTPDFPLVIIWRIKNNRTREFVT